MRTQLLYTATIENGNLITILYRGQAMSNDKSGSWFLGLHVIKSLLHNSLGLVVKSTMEEERRMVTRVPVSGEGNIENYLFLGHGAMIISK